MHMQMRAPGTGGGAASAPGASQSGAGGGPAKGYTADDIADGDPYELSEGRRIECMSSGRAHSTAHDAGHMAVSSDPATHSAPIDLGLVWGDERNLRAPDIVVGQIESGPGWERGVPPLCIEYASSGQDEKALQEKLRALLGRGVRYVWVVRLVGPLRVEVHQPGQPMRLVGEDGELTAEGVLQNPLPVRALVDRGASLAVTLRNLLNRHGYRDLDDVRQQAEQRGEARGEARGEQRGEERGRAEGQAEGQLAGLRDSLRAVLQARGLWSPALANGKEQAARITACSDAPTLQRWLLQAVTAKKIADVFV